MGQKDFVNKTFRLTREDLEKLQADAARAGTTTNGLINTIIRKYLEWDRYARQTNFVSIPANFLNGILAQVSEDEMANAGKFIAEQSCLKDVNLHFFQGYNPKLLARMIALFDKYANTYKVGWEEDSAERRMSLYHEFGKRWSLLWANLIHDELARLGLAKLSYEASDNAILFKFDGSVPISTHVTQVS